MLRRLFRRPVRVRDQVEPTYPSALLGFRGFLLRGDGRLASTGMGGMVWTAGSNHARCLFRATHPVPDPGCSCGLYACYHPRARRIHRMGLLEPRMLASVACRGRVQLHYDGFRAEEAAITGLALTRRAARQPGALRAAQLAAAHYRVPLFSDERALMEHGRRFAQSLPLELLPEEGGTRGGLRRLGWGALVAAVLWGAGCLIAQQWIWPYSWWSGADSPMPGLLRSGIALCTGLMLSGISTLIGIALRRRGPRLTQSSWFALSAPLTGVVFGLLAWRLGDWAGWSLLPLLGLISGFELWLNRQPRA